MNNKLNDIEYDEVKILIIEELTKYTNEHNGFVNNKYLESLDLFNLIDIDDIEEIKSKLAENQVEFIDEGEFANRAILLKIAPEFSPELVKMYLQLLPHDTTLEINFDAMFHNIRYFRSKLRPQTKLMCNP